MIPTSDSYRNTKEPIVQVTEKGQVTIPKHIRTAAGVLPGSEVAFSLEAGKIVISKVSSGIKADRRKELRAAAAKVRKSMSPEFRQMSADEIMAFLRSDEPAKVSGRGKR